jgi:hypothetical protein
MVAVTARRSGMPRKKKRKHQVSTLESIMEWFQRKASNQKSIGLGGGDAAAAAVVAKTRTSKFPAGATTVVTVSPSKSKVKSISLAKEIYPVKRLLGFSKAHPPGTAPPVAANNKDVTPRKPTTAPHASPVKKNIVATKQVIPHKKTAVSAQRSLGFASSLSSPFRSLASSLASSTVKLLPGVASKPNNPPQRRVSMTVTDEHSEVMAVSHALQDELDIYLKDHADELAPSERHELRQWATTVQNQLHVCDRQMMEQIHVEDQVKMELEKQQIRHEIEELKRACMEAEIHAQASRLLFKIDALR